MHKTGEYTQKAVADMYRISAKTVWSWVDRYKKTGSSRAKKNRNPEKPYKFQDKQKILDYLKNHPKSLGYEIRMAPGLAMSTFYDALKRMKITFKKKNLMTKNMMKI